MAFVKTRLKIYAKGMSPSVTFRHERREELIGCNDNLFMT